MTEGSFFAISECVMSKCVERFFLQRKIGYGDMDNCLFHDDRYVLACRRIDTTEYALDILTDGTLEERTKLVDELIRSGTIDRLRRTMKELRGGDRDAEQRGG